MLQELDDGRFGPLISGEGSIVVDCEPKNATVSIARLTETNRQLVAEPNREVGPPPIRLDPMDAGIYRLTLTAPNHEPFQHGRGGARKMCTVTNAHAQVWFDSQWVRSHSRRHISLGQSS